MITRYQLTKLTKKQLQNEYTHLKQWHSKNSIPISKLEELIELIEDETINTHIGERYYVMKKVIQKLIDEAKQ